MDKKQYDAIVDLLGNAERDDLISALEGSTGFHTAQRIEKLEAENEELKGFIDWLATRTLEEISSLSWAEGGGLAGLRRTYAIRAKNAKRIRA